MGTQPLGTDMVPRPQGAQRARSGRFPRRPPLTPVAGAGLRVFYALLVSAPSGHFYYTESSI